VKPHVKYKIRPAGDGGYNILKKDLTNGKVDIHSYYDTLDEAEAELSNLYSRPSQKETLEMFNDLKNQIDKIDNDK